MVFGKNNTEGHKWSFFRTVKFWGGASERGSIMSSQVMWKSEKVFKKNLIFQFRFFQNLNQNHKGFFSKICLRLVQLVFETRKREKKEKWYGSGNNSGFTPTPEGWEPSKFGVVRYKTQKVQHYIVKISQNLLWNTKEYFCGNHNKSLQQLQEFRICLILKKKILRISQKILKIRDLICS